MVLMRLNNKSADHLKTKPKKIKNQDDFWPLIKNLIDKGIEARRPFESKWFINLAYLSGKQHVIFNSSMHILQELKQLKGKRRRVDNQLISRWRRQVADLIKADPIMSVVPESSEDEDIEAARVGDKVLKHFWRQNGIKKKNRILAGWIYATGNGFLDDRWNPKLGPTQVDPKTGKMVYLGDADVGVWSPLEIIVPSYGFGSDELHSFPWLDKVRWRDLSWIDSNFPKKGKEVVSEQMPATMFDMNSLSFQGSRSSLTQAEGAFLHNFYIQPGWIEGHNFPRGAFIVAANGVVLEVKEYPLNHYHIEQFKDIDIPGQFWGKATMGEAIPLQNRWNSTTNSIDEYNRVMAKGKGLVPRGAGLDTMPDDTHGEWIEYKPVMGHKPELLTQKGLPPTLDKMLIITQGSFQDLFSQHEVTKGTNKSDIRSGEMVEILREQDAHGNIPSHSVFEESYERVMQRVLKRIQEGYSVGRMIKVVGKEGQFDIFSFKGSDLRNNTDVSVKQQSSLPDSRIAREASILGRYQAGLYGPMEDPEVRRHVMNMLDDAVVKDLYSDARLDETYARLENKLLVRGLGDHPVNSYDSHIIHNTEHNHFRKKIEYQKQRFENPQAFIQVELIFDAHTQMHTMFIAEAQAKMLEQQRELKGGEARA